SAAGDAFELSGKWNEAAKILNWTSPDGRLEGRWVFKTDDLSEIHRTVKDKGGKTVAEAAGVSRRIASGWVQLFNGKDLSAWRVVGTPANSWQVRDGVLWGSGGETYLVSKQKFAHFHLKAEYRLHPGGDGGILFRADPDDQDLRNRKFKPAGFEMDVTPLDKFTGASTFHSGIVLGSSPQGKWTFGRGPFKADEWLTLDLIVKGNRIEAETEGHPFMSIDPEGLRQT